MQIKRFTIIALILALLVSSCAMADSTVDTIMTVGTTQAFTDEAVSKDDLTTILRAGLAAESAINQQPWYLVAVTNKEIMSELAGSGSGFTPPAGAGEKPEGMPEGKPEGFPEGMPEKPEGMPDGAQAGDGSMPAPPAGFGGGAKAGLGDSPAAIIIYKNGDSKSPDASFDCGLAAQNMYLAAASLGYGVKIVSSPTRTLNGENHDALCEKLGVDPSMQAVAVLLIGRAADTADASSGASVRDDLEAKTSIIE